MGSWWALGSLDPRSPAALEITDHINRLLETRATSCLGPAAFRGMGGKKGTANKTT
jgi:hypothetical protein